MGPATEGVVDVGLLVFICYCFLLVVNWFLAPLLVVDLHL